MRLVSFSLPKDPECVFVGMVSGGKIVVPFWDGHNVPKSVLEVVRDPGKWLPKAQELLQHPHLTYPLTEAQIHAPFTNPEKILCVGLNYADHAKEAGKAPPAEPVIFSKFASALIGPGEAIVIPEWVKEPDYEVELVIVIGKGGRCIPEAKAMEHVFGFTVGHDVSARDWQLKKPGGQWLLGKTFDTFAPIGPCIVTKDELPDPHNLGIRLFLNELKMQASNTCQLIFKTEALIAYISKVVTLKPGDLIFTGTPGGVGFTRKPPVFLKSGDRVACEIDGIGVLENPVVVEAA